MEGPKKQILVTVPHYVPHLQEEQRHIEKFVPGHIQDWASGFAGQSLASNLKKRGAERVTLLYADESRIFPEPCDFNRRVGHERCASSNFARKFRQWVHEAPPGSFVFDVHSYPGYANQIGAGLDLYLLYRPLTAHVAETLCTFMSKRGIYCEIYEGGIENYIYATAERAGLGVALVEINEQLSERRISEITSTISDWFLTL